MNRTIARALLQDAWRQVLDNWVFRLLVVVAGVLILPTFLIGFREDGIHLLFGWKQFSYEEFFGNFGGNLPATDDLQITVIQSVQEILVQGLAGTVGILFCIAATAFFLPRMLEKGAADTLFSKPLSRFVLLLSRYVTGVLFVAVLAAVLVFGMHVGFLLTSGYSDPGFLWSALTLVYVYALIQGFSILVAALTRNSVATILCTLIFYTFTGCLQNIWVGKEMAAETRRAARKEDPEAVQPPDSTHPLLVALKYTLEGLHYALPKTQDADVLTKKLRTIVAPRKIALEDEGGGLTVERDPKDLVREGGGWKVDLAAAPAAWVARRADGSVSERWTLSRRSRIRESTIAKDKDKARTFRETAGQAAREFLKTISVPEGSPEPAKERVTFGQNSVELVSWNEQADKGRVERQRAFLSKGDWMYELDIVAEGSSLGGKDHQRTLHRFVAGIHPVEEAYDPTVQRASYEARFAWTAPLKYNAFFSIGSSLAFVVAMLLLARWRLDRIDF